MSPDDVKTIGIIGGLVASSTALLLNFYSTLRSIKSQKIANYQEIVKSHRDIWKLTLDQPDRYARLFELDVDLQSNPITPQESLFTRLLFLHMSSAYSFAKYSHMLAIENLELDFSEILLSPIPRIIWSENRRYHNKDFVSFLESAGKNTGILEKLVSCFHSNVPDYTRCWKVLLLSAYCDKIRGVVERLGDEVVCRSDADPEVDVDLILSEDVDFIVCFGYGRILKSRVLRRVSGINIHVGYLPYNRGPNPNLWAWLDGTKKGVTIHCLDRGVDTGDIIAQCEITDFENPTLQSSYDMHVEEASKLFRDQWHKIRARQVKGIKQDKGGTSHTLKDQECLGELFDEGGLDLPINVFCQKARDRLNRT